MLIELLIQFDGENIRAAIGPRRRSTEAAERNILVARPFCEMGEWEDPRPESMRDRYTGEALT